MAGSPAPLYVIAVASDAALPQLPSSSSLSDFGLGLLREAEQAFAETRAELFASRAAEKRSSDEAGRLRDELTTVAHERDGALRTLAERPNPEGSVLWRLLEGGRRRFYGAIGGRESRIGRATGSSLRLVGRAMEARARRRSGFGRLTFPVASEPEVSIVIPVHNEAALTLRSSRRSCARARACPTR